MKKGIKILLGILIPIIILIIIYIILVLIKVLPNPFLDTKSLVCKKTNDQISFTYEEIVIIEFNKDATVKEVKEKEIYIFLEEQEAKDYYEQESDNRIDYGSVTKKEIKKRYIEEYSYECE